MTSEAAPDPKLETGPLGLINLLLSYTFYTMLINSIYLCRPSQFGLSMLSTSRCSSSMRTPSCSFWLQTLRRQGTRRQTIRPQSAAQEAVALAGLLPASHSSSTYQGLALKPKEFTQSDDFRATELKKRDQKNYPERSQKV